MTAPVLEVQGLRIESRAGPIVDGLRLEVGEGETVGIVGESGSGKSLTARALVGLLPQGVTASGSARLRGRELIGAGERTWREIRGREIALMLQDPFTMLSPLIRTGPQIAETIPSTRGSRPSREEGKREAVRRLAEVGIHDPEVANLYPFQLSGGMRQRVGLASALASDPSLLIADEPSTALDVTTQREILRLIRATQARRGMSVVLITHDLRVAFATCDRVYVLYAGALVEVADATSLEERPLHPYTYGLLASEPSPSRRVERLTAIPGSVPAAAEVVSECAFAGRCAWALPICRTGRPALREVAPGRWSACVRIKEIADVLVVRETLAATVGPDLAPADSVLRVDNVRKVYPVAASGSVALAGVSISVGEGERVGLVGESGSGKTTLARCVVGLERPSSGTITIGAVDATDYDRLSTAARAQARRSVQIVFQDPYSTLNPARSVGFTLREAARMTDEKPTVAELLGLVGLPASYAERKPFALSGGERQRIAIARALARRPQVLICDEPVSALDVSVQAQILNLLLELNERLGLGYLFITHDLAVVRQVTDRLYVLHRGEVVESGPTERVLDAPAHDYTKTLIDSTPQSDPSWLAPASASVPL